MTVLDASAQSSFSPDALSATRGAPLLRQPTRERGVERAATRPDAARLAGSASTKEFFKLEIVLFSAIRGPPVRHSHRLSPACPTQKLWSRINFSFSSVRVEPI